MIRKPTFLLSLRLCLLTVLLSACGGGESDFDSGRTSAGGPRDGEANGVADGDMDGSGTDADRDGGGSGDGAGNGDGSGTDGEDGGGGEDGGTGAGMGAREFTGRVLPVFQAQCVSCHADPRIAVETRGPLTIYSYDKMRLLLADGGGATNNRLYDKIRNVEAHTGGDRCTSASASPCKEVVAWWVAELGGDAGGGTGKGVFGKVTQVTALGRVYGWAANPGDATEQVTVTFYVNGPKGQGTSVGQTVANRPGPDGNTAGDHAFFVDLPEAARTGKAQTLYAYVTVGGQDELIGGAAFDYTAYAFSAAGRAYFEANVRARLNACTGCHTVAYEQQFYSLIAPSPVEGGTATNNQLLNKPAQANGTGHGGGRLCANPNVSPCSEIQQWWRTEFGD